MIAHGTPALPPALLEAWRRRFVNRSRPYALQQPDWTYRWVYEECTAEVVDAHLHGEVTLALSSTDARGWCRWACLDLDDADPEAMARFLALRAALAARHLPGLVEAS